MYQTCRSWAAYLLQLIRLVLPDYKAEHNRPSNSKFTCWAMGVRMRIAPDADALVHSWLQSKLGHRQITKVTQLQQLPVALTETPVVEKVGAVGLHRYWPN